jgi:hypothetical protein
MPREHFLGDEIVIFDGDLGSSETVQNDAPGPSTRVSTIPVVPEATPVPGRKFQKLQSKSGIFLAKIRIEI